MKTLKKFWGIALVVIMLATLFLGTAVPASAANYAFSADITQPSTFSGGLLPTNLAGTAAMTIATYNIYANAQSGSTIYTVLGDTTAVTGHNLLYKSVDGGATWVACAAIFIPNTVGTDVWNNVAVAPDDPNFVVVIDHLAASDNVWVSTNGGITFSMLTAPAILVIKAVTVSPGAAHMIAIGGVTVGVQMAQVWTIGTLAGAWAGLNLPVAGIDGCSALQFSPNYAADLCLIAVYYENTVAPGYVFTGVYSFNGLPGPALGWNPVGYNFPRQVMMNSNVAAAGITVPKASMALDANFYLGDESTQIGFIGASITDTALGQVGGIYRFDYAATTNRTLTKVYGTATAGTAINSVAWDGTNLIAAVLAGAGQQAIQRSASALSVLPAFSPVAAIKAPYGTNPLVYFNGGVAYCTGSGVNGGITKSTDLGKTWTGFALLGTNFATISNFWQSTDGAVSYYVADDGSNIDIWSKVNGVWTRIAILPGAATASTWLVRADNDVPNTVYVGNQLGNTMYKSLDGGATWTTRAAGGAIQDFVVQDANTIYVAVSATANVIKSTTGAFTWSAQTATGMAAVTGAGTCYSINLLGDGKLIVGGTTGGVAYTADGSTTWTALPTPIGAAATIATASGLATGDTIWAGGTAGAWGNWVIGTNNIVTGWNAGAFVAPGIAFTSIDGLAYVNGSLFVLDSGNGLYKYLYPTGSFGVNLGQTDYTADATVYAGGTTLNALQYAATTNDVIWTRAIAAIDSMVSFTDYSIGPAQAPAPTAPINGAIAQINSINGAVNNFNFFWDGPAAVIAATPGIGYNYDLQIYIDQAGTIPVAGSATVPTAAIPTFGVANTISAAAATVAFAGIPGTTYYWRVRVDADSPAESYWSPMASFAVQQLQAIVPVLNSPANGFSVTAGMTPAFSWNPIASVLTYKFQVSTDPAFATTIYETTTASAGAAIPSTVKLTAGTNYFWRVKTLTPAEGDWSAVSNFSIAKPVVVTTAPPQVTPTLTVVIPAATTTSVVITQAAPPPATEVNPSYIWAIIIIGAVLVIAVIVLIVRTRRSV
jgi:hypothetical protein